MVLKLFKKVHFCNFVLTSARNLSLLKQYKYMHPKDLSTHFQKMVIIYYAMAYCFVDNRVWIRRILLNVCCIFFDILIASISWVVAQTPFEPHQFLKECNENFQMQYVNYFNRLTFLAEVSIKLQKCTFLDNLRAITLETNVRTRQMTSFFHLLFKLYF